MWGTLSVPLFLNNDSSFRMKLIQTLFLTFLTLVTGLNCKSQEVGSQVLKPEALQLLIDETENLQLIDVRTVKEVNDGYIANASNIDYYSSDFKSQMDQLDKNAPVAVYCKAGGRSGKAAKMLRDLGFKQIYDLEGGFAAWKAAKLPVVK